MATEAKRSEWVERGWVRDSTDVQLQRERARDEALKCDLWTGSHTRLFSRECECEVEG
jgi:hypothetical protein